MNGWIDIYISHLYFIMMQQKILIIKPDITGSYLKINCTRKFNSYFDLIHHFEASFSSFLFCPIQESSHSKKLTLNLLYSFSLYPSIAQYLTRLSGNKVNFLNKILVEMI